MSTSGSTTGTTSAVLCLGEALIDEVNRNGQLSEHVGGSLLNVACGLATLGEDAGICAWWGQDERGELLRRWATESGVRIVEGTDGAEKTSVAHALLDADGRATYEFDLEWQVPHIEGLGGVRHLHTGSIAATLEPGGTQVVEAVRAVREHGGTISYDPNIRPALMVSPEQVLPRIEELVSLSDVVKASDEDIQWLFGDEPVENVMRRWLGLGPRMVVVTRGPWGAYALLAHNRDLLVVDQMTVEVGDTVGAGDSFMAGMLSGLLDAGLLGSQAARRRLSSAGWGDVQPALHRAVVTSALTVSRSGAYAPTMTEVLAVQSGDAALSD